MLWYPGYPGSKSLGLKSAELALDCYSEPPNHIETNHSIWLAMVTFILSVYLSLQYRPYIYIYTLYYIYIAMVTFIICVSLSLKYRIYIYIYTIYYIYIYIYIYCAIDRIR